MQGSWGIGFGDLDIGSRGDVGGDHAERGLESRCPVGL